MHSDKPVLSVILPVFNCEAYVGNAIESILYQTFSAFELLIADDGSSDKSRVITERYAKLDRRIRLFHNSSNLGKVWTVNNLLKYCQGEFVTVHDADDCSDPTRFAKQISLLRQDEKFVMCGTSFRMVNADGSLFREVVMLSDFGEIRNRIKNSSQFHGPTMVMRRGALDGNLYRSFFDEFNEDCDLALRLIEKGYCANLTEILYVYRILPNSLSKNITPRRKNLYKMAVAFYEQRTVYGKDDLMEGRNEAIEERLNHLMEPYMKDVSRIYRENAAFMMYYRLYRQAVYNAWKAFAVRPFYFENFRTLQYCIRKTLFSA